MQMMLMRKRESNWEEVSVRCAGKRVWERGMTFYLLGNFVVDLNSVSEKGKIVSFGYNLSDIYGLGNKNLYL